MLAESLQTDELTRLKKVASEGRFNSYFRHKIAEPSKPKGQLFDFKKFSAADAKKYTKTIKRVLFNEQKYERILAK